MLAYTYFKTKRGDPYSMLTVSRTLLAMAHRPDVNIGLENYTPLALFAIDPQTIMVPADSPFTTFKELVEAARQQPDSLVAATTSIQGTGRLVLYLIEKAVPGAKFKFVTFKGGGEAVTSVAGGHTHFTTENLSEGLGLLEAKKLRVLAIAADRRLPQHSGRADAAGTRLPGPGRDDTRICFSRRRAEGGCHDHGGRARACPQDATVEGTCGAQFLPGRVHGQRRVFPVPRQTPGGGKGFLR